MSYEVRIERESEELVLYFREEGTSNWRVAARKIFPAVQAARATNLQLSAATAQELITTFEEWGCRIPEELGRSGAAVLRK